MAKTYEVEVEGIGIIHRVAKPFDEALKTLKNAGANLISARNLAYARVKEGEKSDLSRYGSYVREGVVYIPSKTLFIRDSPLLNQFLAQKAVKAHRSGSEFYVEEGLTKKYQKQAEQDKDRQPEKRKTLILNKRGSFEIPTNRFKDEELTLWLFKDQAEAYGNFLKDNKINEMPVYLSGDTKGNFTNLLWLGDLAYRSNLNGSDRNLYYCDYVRGVLRKSAEGTSQKIKAYTPKQISRVLRKLKLSGLEKQILSNLRN